MFVVILSKFPLFPLFPPVPPTHIGIERERKRRISKEGMGKWEKV